MSDPKPTEGVIEEAAEDIRDDINKAIQAYFVDDIDGHETHTEEILRRHFGDQTAQVKQLQEENARLSVLCDCAADLLNAAAERHPDHCCEYEEIANQLTKAINPKEPI